MSGPWSIDLHVPGTIKQGMLSANERCHWARKARVTADWRTRAGWAARQAKLPKLERASIVVFISFGDKRRRDVANYHPTVKAIVDGLVDAGLLPDDNDTHLQGPDLRRADFSGVRMVRVVITALPAEDVA